MGKIEDIIVKDRITASNQEMFDSICRRIEKEQQNKLPNALGVGMKLCCCLIALLSVLNFVLFASVDKVQTSERFNDEEYHAFAKENYFDILSDYYPEELLKEE